MAGKCGLPQSAAPRTNGNPFPWFLPCQLRRTNAPGRRAIEPALVPAPAVRGTHGHVPRHGGSLLRPVRFRLTCRGAGARGQSESSDSGSSSARERALAISIFSNDSDLELFAAVRPAGRAQQKGSAADRLHIVGRPAGTLTANPIQVL